MPPLLLASALILSAAAGPVEAWHAGFGWRSVGPHGVVEVADVAAAGARAALVTDDGDVWLSTDAGASWSRVLAGERAGATTGFTEAALFDVELRVDELLDEVDAEPLDPGVDPVAEIEERLRTEALPDAFAPVTAARREARWAWRVEVDAASVTVGRPDGLWRADADGHGWRRVEAAAAEAWVALGERRLVGGPGGLVVAGIDEPAGTALPAVHDLVRVDDGVLAATDDGVWWSADGLAWRPVAGRLRAWRRVATADGERWAADVGGVVRVDGDALAAPIGPPLEDVRDLLVEADGIVVVAARGGAWVSRDGGATFGPLGEGLEGADGRGLARCGADLWVATDRGLYALVADAPPDVERPGVPLDGALPPLGVLRDAALRQLPEVGGRGRVGAWLLPQVTVEASWAASDARTVVGTLGSGLDGAWQVTARATWRPPTGGGTTGGVQGLVAVADEDGVVQVYSGPFDAWVLLAHAGRRLRDERLRRIDLVAELVARRDALARERLGTGRPLREVVAAELRIDEVEAWLDALTDGAVERWRRAGRQG
jgi:hypothetical protein